MMVIQLQTYALVYSVSVVSFEHYSDRPCLAWIIVWEWMTLVKWCVQKFQKNKLILESQPSHNLFSRETLNKNGFHLSLTRLSHAVCPFMFKLHIFKDAFFKNSCGISYTLKILHYCKIQYAPKNAYIFIYISISVLQ